MKNCKAAQMYTSSGAPFTVFGKRKQPGVVIEWAWGCETVRMPMWEVVRNPDIAMGWAFHKAMGKIHA